MIKYHRIQYGLRSWEADWHQTEMKQNEPLGTVSNGTPH